MEVIAAYCQHETTDALSVESEYILLLVAFIV
jgi:hypothetical protein